MNEELTNEALEAMERCGEDIGDQCTDCPAKRICHAFDALVRIKFLATALLEERAKPKVWDGAPEWATIGRACWTDKKHGEAWSTIYRRELPKTRIDEIIDESLDGRLFGMRVGKSEMREILGTALTKYAEELTNTKETN